MNTSQLTNLTGPATKERSRRSEPLLTETRLVVGLVVAATALWGLWRALGVDLTVHSGSGTSTVGVASVIVSTAVVGIAALGLRRALARIQGRRGLRAWTIVAVAAWLVSFLGPTQATTADAGAALLTFHLLVGGGIIVGVRRLHGEPRGRTER